MSLFLVALLWIQGMLRPFNGFARNAFDTFFLSNLLTLTLGALYFYIFLVQSDVTKATAVANSEKLKTNQIVFYSVVVGLAYIGIFIIIIWHLVLRYAFLEC